MKRRNNRTAKVARTALAAVAALGLLMAFMGTGSADPANNGTASAFGLEATGILPISRTPEVTQTGEGRQEQNTTLNRERQALVDLPISTLAVEALLNTVAEVRLAGGINGIAVTDPRTANQDPIDLRDVNVRSYAAANDLAVLIGNDPNPADQVELIEEALVDLKTVEAEAVAKCVNNAPVFDTGFNMLGDNPDDVLGINLQPVEDLVFGIVDTLLGDTGLAASLIKVDKGIEEKIPDGIRITALRISVLGTTEVINVAQAEAKMSSPCGIAASPSPSPAARLAQTGGGGMSSILGGSLLAGAVLMMIFVRKYRLSE